MYGLLLESIGVAIQARYGAEMWQEVKAKSATANEFLAHQTYVENCFPSLLKSLSELTGEPLEEIYDFIGVSFVKYVSLYGYDAILRVLGRNLRDFLNGLDNLHEYLRGSYPRMRSPSFFVEHENSKGITLHYRSKRKGYIHYVMGQIKEVAMRFYNKVVELEVIQEDQQFGQTHVIIRVHFDNKGCGEGVLLRKGTTAQSKKIEIDSSIYLKLFPFHILFGHDMRIRSIGKSLKFVMRDILNKRLHFVFNLTRPPIGFTFENILRHTNCTFELTSVKIIGKRQLESTITETDLADVDGSISLHLRMKGQMKYLDTLDCLIFLATPVIDSINRMFELGLFINDLSMHDVSRDLVLIGVQQSKELKSALKEEKNKGKRLDEITMKVGEEIRKIDVLLYQMIPRKIADMLRKGESIASTCQAFEEVTLMFSDIVNFLDICSSITPMQIVGMLNSCFLRMDRINDRQKVYKVETVGATYMMVGGAPVKHKQHAVYIAETALAAIEAIQEVTDPRNGDHLNLRIGIHTGPVVAGVIGLNVPRYCLFGETVNTASRLQINGQPMRIHISESSKVALAQHPYETEPKGKVTTKTKGDIKTHFLVRRTIEGPYVPHEDVTSSELSFVDKTARERQADAGGDQAPAKPDDTTSISAKPAKSIMGRESIKVWQPKPEKQPAKCSCAACCIL